MRKLSLGTSRVSPLLHDKCPLHWPHRVSNSNRWHSGVWWCQVCCLRFERELYVLGVSRLRPRMAVNAAQQKPYIYLKCDTIFL